MTSVSEYLATCYRPDCDYVDGQVLERNTGELEHSGTVGEVVYWLKSRYPRLRWGVLPSVRVQVKPARFRIPDVCVLAESAPRDKIIRTAPILCVEILSPEDTMTEMIRRIQDYFGMGVPVCWILDPVGRRAWVATPGHLDEALDGVLRGEIEMPLAEIYEDLLRAQASGGAQTAFV
ncbi:MAG: Uma2 family endonuclease [Terriglobia bacterium]